MFGSLFKTERRAIQATAWGDWGDGALWSSGGPPGTTWAGANVTTNSSLQLLTVYGCNRFICDGISTLPVERLRDTGTEIVEMPKPGWLEEPVADLDPIAWETQLLTSKLLAGNSYCAKDYTDIGLRTLLPLDPTKVDVKRVQGRKTFLISGQEFDSARILHIPGVMFPGADKGLSPIEAARQTIGMGMAAQEFGARFFGQGAVMSGVIEDPGEVSPDKARAMAQAWGRAHSGKSRSHLPGVLQGGAHWVSTGVTNEQAQFLQTRGFTASEIAGQMFMIDPTEMGLPAASGSSITYANLEQRNIRKVEVTFLPWIVRFEKAFSALLPKPQYVKINVSGLLRADTEQRFKAYAVAIQNRFMTPNEARAFEDWGTIEGGDRVQSDIVITAPKV